MIFVFLLLALIGYWLLKRLGSAAPRLRQSGKCFREIVGESHYQENLRKIASRGAKGSDGLDAVAILVPENRNAHDPGVAVRVEIKNKLVGYLSHEDAVSFRKALTAAKLAERSYSVGAKIYGGGKKFFGVWIDLPDRL